MPETGWDDLSIELTLAELAAMDSNNFCGNCGVGEREGRVYSKLVARRHSQLSHGIGRSGDLDEAQPKAAGSSILYKLTTCLALHAVRTAGLTNAKGCLLLPLATGMSLSMCMLKLRFERSPDARYVIWPRIDQKSCFKCISTCGLTPLVVPGKMERDSICTDVEAIEELLQRLGPQVLQYVDENFGSYA